MRHLNHKQKLLLGVLGVGIVALAVDQAVLGPSSSSAAPIPAPQAAPPAPAAAQSPAPQPKAPAGPDLRDLLAQLDRAVVATDAAPDVFARVLDEAPAAPPASNVEPIPQAPTDVSLSAVLLGSGRALAVINGKTYRVGDVVQGYTVRSISQFEVLLERGGRTFPIRVPVEGTPR